MNNVGSKHSLNLASLCNVIKEKHLLKNYKNYVTWKPVSGSIVFIKNQVKSLLVQDIF